nr:formin-like protein 5 [Lolium perenne]
MYSPSSDLVAAGRRRRRNARAPRSEVWPPPYPPRRESLPQKHPRAPALRSARPHYEACAPPPKGPRGAPPLQLGAIAVCEPPRQPTRSSRSSSSPVTRAAEPNCRSMDPVRPPVLFKLQRLYFLSAMPRSGREHEFWWPYVPSPAYLSPAYLLCSWCAQRYPALYKSVDAPGSVVFVPLIARMLVVFRGPAWDAGQELREGHM